MHGGHTCTVYFDKNGRNWFTDFVHRLSHTCSANTSSIYWGVMNEKEPAEELQSPLPSVSWHPRWGVIETDKREWKGSGEALWGLGALEPRSPFCVQGSYDSEGNCGPRSSNLAFSVMDLTLLYCTCFQYHWLPGVVSPWESYACEAPRDCVWTSSRGRQQTPTLCMAPLAMSICYGLHETSPMRSKFLGKLIKNFRMAVAEHWINADLYECADYAFFSSHACELRLAPSSHQSLPTLWPSAYLVCHSILGCSVPHPRASYCSPFFCQIYYL